MSTKHINVAINVQHDVASLRHELEARNKMIDKLTAELADLKRRVDFNQHELSKLQTAFLMAKQRFDRFMSSVVERCAALTADMSTCL